VEFFRSIVFQDADWDPKTLNFAGDVDRAERVHPAVNAVDPDLSAFVARGGRLLMYGGWADTAINPGAETDYYRSVVGKLGEARARSAIRLYMLPMMGHFLGGGNGPHTYELDTQRLMELWVEQRNAPGAVSAAHKANGVQDRIISLCPYPQVTCDAADLIDATAAAMGGRDRILGVRTLTIEGYATNPNLGQQMTPESELLLWMIPDYARRLDLVNDRMELSLTRRPAFPAVFDNARAVQRLDGDVAYNVAANATAPPARLSAQVARDRRIERLHHPLTILRAALESGASAANVRQAGSGRSLDITTRHGDTVTLTVDAMNRPTAVRSMAHHANLGDVARVTTFGAYENIAGLRLPKRIVTTVDRWTEFDIGVMKHTLDADLASLAAPEATRTSPPAPDVPPQNVTVTALANGIWFLTGAGVPSIVVEFADHAAIVEVPASEARTQAVIAKAKELVPGKPLTQAIVTHHHVDHTGGLRAAVAEGLTIVTHRINENWFREMVKRKHSIVVDALAKTPKPLKIVSIDDSYTIEDASMEMQLVHLVNSSHGDGIIAIYFPRERLYAEADVWNPAAQIQPHVRSLAEDIARRKLQIDRIVPLHGNAVQPYAAFEAVVKEWSEKR
jgi:glyoxylase-like metal-dependent hydrolase (beta-lactamase superfamily II)